MLLVAIFESMLNHLLIEQTLWKEFLNLKTEYLKGKIISHYIEKKRFCLVGTEIEDVKKRKN